MPHSEEQFDQSKVAVLDYVRGIFDEMEEDMAISHQEKYALLEDAFENATDMDELRVAFEQWYNDHSAELEFEFEVEELWDQAINSSEE